MSVIGIDIEYYTFEPKVGCISLVQISTGEKDFIIDPLINRTRVGEFLREIMMDPKKLKLFHGADSDLLWLQNDFLAHAVNVFDTSRAYKIISKDSNLPSLASLLLQFLNIKADKTFQVAD